LCTYVRTALASTDFLLKNALPAECAGRGRLAACEPAQVAAGDAGHDEREPVGEPDHHVGAVPGHVGDVTGTAAPPGRVTQAAPAGAGMPDGRGVTGIEVRL